MARKTAKDMDQLIRINQWGVDERQRELGVLAAREDQLIAAGRKLDEDLKNEQAIASQDPTLAGCYGNFAQLHRQRKEQLHKQIHALRQEIEAARDRLAEAYRQLKVYEEVQKERAKREALDEARQEQQTMDEIGMTQFRRRQSDD